MHTARLLPLLITLLAPLGTAAQTSAEPAMREWDRKAEKALSKLAEDWFEARPPTRFEAWDPQRRAEFEARLAEFTEEHGELPPGRLESTAELLLEAAADSLPAPKLKSGKLTFETPWGEAWAYLDNKKADAGLLIGLHGGGPGVGDAGAARGSWALKGLAAIYPQAVRLDTDAWNTVHGERFILTLIDHAKVQLGVDPDRVYSVGFSMGGSGTWHLAGRYPDVLAGAIPAHGVIMAAPKAQLAAKEDVRLMQHGMLPNVRNLSMYWYTGSVDVNCMPGTYLYAWDRLQELAAADEGGYTAQRFTLHEGLDHSFPAGEPQAGLDWILEQRRDTFPETVVWHFASDPFPLPEDRDPLGRLQQDRLYWLGCAEPADLMQVHATRDGARFVLETTGGAGFSISLHPEMVPYGEEVTVVDAAGAELYRGTPEPRLEVLLESFDARLDRRMCFDRRIEL